MTNTKSSPFSVDQARELMAAIRRQVFVPEVTTMGPCPRCGAGSRGGSDCADCLADDLDRILETADGHAYVAACRRQREAERSVMSQVEMMGGGLRSTPSYTTAPPLVG